ncbi:SsrA-binding protein SmpB [Candidatus Parcubacteria bacterium]|nr:MAG: SsrA-binding protein SmpB [Candidatus Parcubacteria bacterium]
MTRKIICSNRRARHDFFLEETYEAGIALLGPEVKAIRNHKISLGEGWVKIQNGEAFLIGCHVACKAGGWEQVDPLRVRKLLLKKSQLKKLEDSLNIGRIIIPISVYCSDRNLIKLEIAVAVGKKKYDKRQVQKLREFKREQQYQS